MFGRASDDSGLFDRIVRTEDPLDFARGDVEAAGDDEFLHPVDDGGETILVLNDDIASADPTAGEQHLGRLLGVLPVPLEDLRAGKQQFTLFSALDLAVEVLGVDDLHVGRRKRDADRAGAA